MSIQSATELLKRNITRDAGRLHIMSVMQGNRKERRRIAAANGVARIAGSNKPFVSTTK